MRIISGKYRGLQIPMPSKGQIRPTTDRSREALFNILVHRYDFEDIQVLDLFGGSGAVAIEFSSRGALNVDCVEMNARVVGSLKAFISKSNIDAVNVLQADAFKYINSSPKRYDLIFADPPYHLAKVPQIPALVIESPLLEPRGVFILEHEKGIQFPETAIPFEQRAYGQSVFSFFSK